MSTDYCRCPNCDGKLEYRADHRMFGCDSCQSFFNDDQIKKLFKGKNRSGAAKSAEEKSERPEFIIPFEITAERAAEIFRENAASGKFLPGGLVSAAENPRGVYLPVWMADSEVSIRMNGTGKKVRAWICDVHRYTETREFASERKAEAEYSSVPAYCNGRSELRVFTENCDLNKMKRYSDGELGKFTVEYCTVNKGEAFKNVRRRVTDDIRRALKKSVSDYSDFSVSNESIDILRTDWYCTLFPVWIFSCSCEGREYTFYVNGQNGEFSGQMPVSVKKLALTGGGILLGTTLLYRGAELLFRFAGNAAESGYFFRSTGAGILLGAVASALSVFLIVHSCRKKTEEVPDSESCPGNNDIKFTMKTDRYVRQYTTKVKAE